MYLKLGERQLVGQGSLEELVKISFGCGDEHIILCDRSAYTAKELMDGKHLMEEQKERDEGTSKKKEAVDQEGAKSKEEAARKQSEESKPLKDEKEERRQAKMRREEGQTGDVQAYTVGFAPRPPRSFENQEQSKIFLGRNHDQIDQSMKDDEAKQMGEKLEKQQRLGQRSEYYRDEHEAETNVPMRRDTEEMLKVEQNLYITTGTRSF